MYKEKMSQAVQILQEQNVDLWLTFVRESSAVPDPVMDLLVGAGVVWPAAFLISRAIKNTKLSGEVAEALEGYGFPILAHGTTQRVIYPTSAASGQTVFSEPGNAAIEEIEAIAKDVLELLP